MDYKDLRKPQLNWNPLKCIYNSSMCVLYVVWHQLIKHDHRCCGQHLSMSHATKVRIWLLAMWRTLVHVKDISRGATAEGCS